MIIITDRVRFEITDDTLENSENIRKDLKAYPLNFLRWLEKRNSTLKTE